MRSEAIQKLVGRPVKDFYGRYAGFVVGFSVDTNGELQFVGIDQGNGEFAQFPQKRVLSDHDGLVVLPQWKLDVDSLRRETEAVRKRILALETLVREGEVSRPIYEQMRAQYDGQINDLQQSHSALLQSLTKRLEYLDTRSQSLEVFLANVKVQFRAGEIDEGTFKVAIDYCTAMKARDLKESEDIGSVLRLLAQPATRSQAAAAVKPSDPFVVETVSN